MATVTEPLPARRRGEPRVRVSQNTFIWIDPDSTDFIMCGAAAISMVDAAPTSRSVRPPAPGSSLPTVAPATAHPAARHVILAFRPTCHHSWAPSAGLSLRNPQGQRIPSLAAGSAVVKSSHCKK